MEQVRDYELKAFFTHVIDVLECLQISQSLTITSVRAVHRSARASGVLDQLEELVEAVRQEVEE